MSSQYLIREETPQVLPYDDELIAQGLTRQLACYLYPLLLLLDQRLDKRLVRTFTRLVEVIVTFKDKLTEQIIPLYKPESIGTKQASVVQNSLHDPTFLQACIEQLALNDEQLLVAYVEGETISEDQVQTALVQQVRDAKLSLVFFGSAIIGVEVKELLADLGSYFPSTSSLEEASLSGVVFKLERVATGEKVAYVRVFPGTMRVRTFVTLHRRKLDGNSDTYSGKIQKLHLFWEGKTVQVQEVGAGEFCKVWGLKEVKIGDVVGEESEHLKTLHFAIPQLETQIEATHHEQNHQLYQALLELSEEDPLISVLKDDVHQILYLRIFGEVQKEVIETLLKEQHGLDVRFSETGIICVEKPRGIGKALEIMGAAENPFVATVGFLVEPGPSVAE